MDAKTLYQHLVAINNAEQQMYWTRYNIFLVINTGALSVFAFVLKLVPSSDPIGVSTAVPFIVPLAVTIAGLTLACGWLVTTISGNGWITFWHDRLRELEEKWSDSLLPRPFSLAKTKRRRNVLLAIKGIAVVVPLVFILIWVGILMFQLQERDGRSGFRATVFRQDYVRNG
jgi:hypothetical protein